MKRAYLAPLHDWLAADIRKPLIMRGARQVGKTWLVRHLANSANKQLVELNFEKEPQLISLFKSNDPKQILINLEASLNFKIDTNNCLLFLDEIQAAPEVLAKLRWFAEELAEMPVITAGSLLEFVLSEHTFSMPVGRISYMHIEPFSFEEFLLANDKQQLCEYLLNYRFPMEIPRLIHEQLIALFKEYMIIGGMPAVVSNWVSERSLTKVSQIQQDLLATFRDDFSKYSGRIKIQNLDEVMMAVPRMLGQKFIYSRISPNIPSHTIKQALDLLNKARICHCVVSCAANGVPLAAEIREKYFKEKFLDTGLASAALGLTLNLVNAAHEITLINNGALAEQVVGQLLRTINPFYIEPALYYWQREEKGSNAEVDYVIQHNNQVIPIEVKAGSTGSLKSLHLFMSLKALSLAVRINSDLPSTTQVKVKDHAGKPVDYNLLSLPFYLLSQLHRLIDEIQGN